MNWRRALRPGALEGAMPTYDYVCDACGHRFDLMQAMKDDPVSECPKCRGKVRRVVSGGAGVIVKGAHPDRSASAGGCSFEQHGRTCCGRDEKCGSPPCGGRQ